MILVDLNQVMISNLMQQINSRTDVELSPDLIRHMVFNALRSYKVKFGKEFGRMIICCDNKDYWRKKYFPYYKANRKKTRDESGFDWNLIFECLNTIKREIKEYSPYLVIEIEHAEADDIIGTISHTVREEPILILSGDKDFQQLQIYDNIKQYSPILKKFIACDNAETFLIEHIITGDSGDGVPNILSDDDAIVSEDKRQKPIRKDKIAKWVSDLDSLLGSVNRINYDRNKKLIDLREVPDEIKQQILSKYNGNMIEGGREKLLNLFIAKRMKMLIEVLEEF